MSHSVTLNWNAPAPVVGTDAPSSYKVYKANAQAGPFSVLESVSVLTAVDTAVSAGNTYWFQVTSVNSGGESGPSNEVQAGPIPFLAPGVPASLVATVV